MSEPKEIMMFCEGDSVEVAGYACNFIYCSEADKGIYKEQGYVDHPAELYGTVDFGVGSEPGEAGVPTEEQLRAEAKAKGIKSWHVKGIDTLKEELGYDS